MSGSITTVTSSNSVVTITATSPVTASIIGAVFAAVSTQAPGSSFTYSPTSTAIPAGDTTLYVTAGSTGIINAPTSYTDILIDVNAGPVTVTGGSDATTIVGDAFTYSGTAAVVASGDGIANVSDSANNAQIAFGSASTVVANGSGNNQLIQLGDFGVGSITSSGTATTVLAGVNSTTTITANGPSETIDIGNGAKTTVNLTGNDTINIGTGAPTAPALMNAAGIAPTPAPVSVTSVNSMSGVGNTFNIAANATGFATANIVLQLGSSDTVNVAGGIDSIFGNANDLVNNVSGSVDFVGQSSASTVFGGTGQTTVFAISGGQVFDVGTATQSSNSNVFVGGSVASTINAGTGGGVFFGGSHGDLYNIGTSSVQTFVGTGGNDTVNGADSTVAPTLFALGTDHMQLIGTPQITVVAFEGAAGSTVAGAGGTVDASSTTANNVFFTGYGSTGNETLIGSAATTGATHDIFEVGAASLGGAAASSVPANITITNWHSGDAFFLIGYGAADNQTMDAATTVSAQPGANSGLTFTLSDNTKVTFVGSHPTNFNTTANAIF